MCGDDDVGGTEYVVDGDGVAGAKAGGYDDAIDAFPGRIERDNWVGGAQEQYEKKYKRKADA